MKRMLGTLVLVAALLSSACGQDAEEAFKVLLDEATGEYVVQDLSGGAIWMRCAVGRTWDEGQGACIGDSETMTCAEAEVACPEGFRLAGEEEYKKLMCGYIAELTDECPWDRFHACDDCETCRRMFPGDEGTYIFDGFTESDESCDNTVVQLSPGCVTEDVTPLEAPYFQVRCVKE